MKRPRCGCGNREAGDGAACWCRRYRHPAAGSTIFPETLKRGVVGFVMSCRSIDNPDDDNLVVLDLKTARSRVLASELPPLASFTWNLEHEAGLISDSEELCASVAFVTAEGVDIRGIELAEGDRTFSVDEGFDSSDIESCGQPMLVEWPAWSPDGETIAFYASARIRRRGGLRQTGGAVQHLPYGSGRVRTPQGIGRRAAATRSRVVTRRSLPRLLWERRR
jgi:hypothetical protein